MDKDRRELLRMEHERYLAGLEAGSKSEYNRTIKHQSDTGYKSTKVEAGWRNKQADADLIRANLDKVTTGLSLWNTLKPILVVGVFILFLIGPGVSAITQIFGSTPLWVWGLVALCSLLIWRTW